MNFEINRFGNEEDNVEEKRSFCDDAADKAVAALEAAGFEARAWVKPGIVRVYVKTGKGKDCGFFAILDDGSIDRSGLDKQAGTISSIAAEAVKS